MYQRLAVPRFTGSPSLQDIQEAIERLLTDWGYAVRRHAFVTSSVRLSAVSLLGAGFGWLALVLYPLLVLPVPAWAVCFVGLGGLFLLAVVGFGMVTGRLRTGATPLAAVNLEARRGEPKLWLVAHADSKGQRLSLRGRVIAVIVFGAAIAALVGALAVRLFDPLPWWAAMVITVLALFGGGAVSQSAPRNDSPGAVDNAAGVIAVLAAAHELRALGNVGVLITDAEELGMEGARAWIGLGRGGVPFVNFDGVDSQGPYRTMVHRAAGTAVVPARSPQELASDIAVELRERGADAKVGRLPPGVLVDGVVLAGGGMPGVTVSRGTWATLGVIHTARDVAERLDMRAALEVGYAVARVVRRMD